MMLSTLEQAGVGRVLNRDCEFTSLSTDTRNITPGQLFVALVGDNFDAHAMLEKAQEKGACALVVMREMAIDLPQLIVADTTRALGAIGAVFRHAFIGKVVALTGSSGKTTVKGMLHEVLSRAGGCVSTQGNYNNHIGVPLTLARLENNAAYAVVEAGTNHPGEIAYLSQLISPDVAMLTSIMPAHIGHFGRLSAIAEEKAEIFTDAASTVVVNLDMPYLDVIAPKLNGKRVIGFSMNATQGKALPFELQKVIAPTEIRTDELGRVAFTVPLSSGLVDAQLAVFGRHNIANALAAVAAADSLGVAPEVIVEGLQAYQPDAGRMQYVAGIRGARIINDTYNANPGSMKAAIDFLADFSNSILVCGDIGELGEATLALHEEVGAYAKEKEISQVFSVGEHSAAITRAFGSSGTHFENKDALLDALLPKIQQDSVVLVKGSRAAAMETVVEALSASGGN